MSDENTSPDKLKYTCQNHRDFMGTTAVHTVGLDSVYRTDWVSYSPNLLQFDTFRLLVLDDTPPKSLTIVVHSLLIRHSPKLRIEDLVPLVAFQEVVFDGSNAAYKVKKWKKECKALGIRYWDTGEKGAWVKEL